MKTARMLSVITGFVALGFGGVLFAQSDPAQAFEGTFLSNFEGSFSGSGTLRRGVDGGGRSINCTVTGTQQGGNAIVIQGSCGVLVFRSGVSAQIQFDPASGAYRGLWQDRNSTSDLSGSRSGDTLTLAIQRRGGAAASGAAGQMVVRSLGPDRYQLTVSTVGEADRPQRVDVTLQRS